MDTRNYDERYNCGLENCDCDEDNNCGCSFPNNISNFTCSCDKDVNCGCIQLEEPATTYIKKESICVCTPEECDCSIEHTETEQ